MDVLPPELVRCVLEECLQLHRCEKNQLLSLRLVCKNFDAILREYACKTIQIEVSRLVRGDPTPNMETILTFGHLSKAMFLDMMVVRDQEEVDRLTDVFKPIIDDLPDMKSLLDHLTSFCMVSGKWDEINFRAVMDGVLQNTPNMSQIKINLPFQVIGRASETATLLLANTFYSLAKRPYEFKRLETLALDHITDVTTLSICRNPMDLKNAKFVFEKLMNLVITIKLQELTNQGQFASNLWLLITEASHLESLCIIGWCTKRNSRRRSRQMTGVTNWATKALPYAMVHGRELNHLRFLELKRIDISAEILMRLVEDNSASLKELFLCEVHLKVFGNSGQQENALWIGRGPSAQKPDRARWIAEELRSMLSLKLDIFRVSELGYDNYDADRTSAGSYFDLYDPLGLERSFDERFIGTFLGIEPDPQSGAQHAVAITALMASIPASATPPSTIDPRLLNFNRDEIEWTPECSQLEKARRLRELEYDADTFQKQHNTTSHWKRSIDGIFHNHNQKALTELQRIIEVADKGMEMLSASSVHQQRLTRP